MSVPTWLSAIGHFASDVIGAMFGFQVAEIRKQGAEIAGKEIKKALMPDRPHIMQELLAPADEVGDSTKELVELLLEANRDGFIEVGKRRYMENWIVNMLLKIEPRYRQPVFQQLNEVLKTKGREQFFAYLEVLHNDGLAQYLKWFQAEISEVAGKAKVKLGKAAKDSNDWAANTAAPQVDKFLRRLEKLDRKERRAERKGVRR
jgi:hypothetical protein